MAYKLVVIAPERRAGDPGSNSGPDENISLKLIIHMQILVAMKTYNIFC